MLPISVCIIAKNEEAYLEECLKRLTKYDWEIVIVDTGSTDRTLEIAQKYTSSVYSFTWMDDFSAARNYSISKAKNDYILALDCDEYLEENEQTAEIISKLPSYITEGQIGMFIRRSSTMGNSSSENNGSSKTVSGMVNEYIMRFFHRSKMHFEGRIHEQLVSKNGSSKDYVFIPLSFYHMGYETPEIRRRKAERNIGLLEVELTLSPNDPYTLFQLGQSYFGMADYSKALPYFDKALSMELDEQAEYVQTLVESYGYCLLYLKQYKQALELEGVYSIFAKRADFVFLMGLIYMNNALFSQAIQEFEKATTIINYSVEGVNSYSANYNIGVIYECMGQTEKARKYYSKCKSYPPALERLNLIN